MEEIQAVTSKDSSKFIIAALVIILLLVGGWIGYALGSANKNVLPQSTRETSTSAGFNPIFTSQEAFISGQITGISGKTITITGANDKTENFNAAPGFGVYMTSAKNPSATVSADIKSIQLNRPATIDLRLNSAGVYEVQSVYYPLTVQPPLPSPSSNESAGHNIPGSTP